MPLNLFVSIPREVAKLRNLLAFKNQKQKILASLIFFSLSSIAYASKMPMSHVIPNIKFAMIIKRKRKILISIPMSSVKYNSPQYIVVPAVNIDICSNLFSFGTMNGIY